MPTLKSKKEILYSKLLEELVKYTLDDANQETFIADNPDLENDYLSAANLMMSYREEILDAESNDEIYTKFVQLLEAVERFHKEFPNYPGIRIAEVEALIQLQIIYQRSGFDGHPDYNFLSTLDVEDYALFEFNESISNEFFYHKKLDNNYPNDSFILFNLNRDSFSLERSQNIDDLNELTDEFLLHLIDKFCSNDALHSRNYLMMKSSITEERQRESYVCFEIVKKGDFYHIPTSYNQSPNVNQNQLSLVDSDYRQFQDTLSILTEYNRSNDILQKYLKLYQVLENFMTRRIISEQLDSAPNQIFSLRRIKVLSKDIGLKESSNLAGFFKQCWALDSGEIDAAGQNISILDLLIQKWTDLSGHPININQADCTNFLKDLGLRNHLCNTAFNSQNIKENYKNLVYSFRNAVVHNKELELHISHNDLISHHDYGEVVRIILESFLIPTLERIVFQLLDQNHGIIWYNHKSINLY